MWAVSVWKGIIFWIGQCLFLKPKSIDAYRVICKQGRKYEQANKKEQKAG
jgi:hypothetical protein